jgi:hypothetical protein
MFIRDYLGIYVVNVIGSHFHPSDDAASDSLKGLLNGYTFVGGGALGVPSEDVHTLQEAQGRVGCQVQLPLLNSSLDGAYG